MATTLDQKKNFAVALSTTALGVSDTSWTLTSGQGANLPDTANGAFNAVIWDQTDSPWNPIASGAGYEIVRVNTRSGDTITSMTRAQEGTSAIALSTGPSFAIAAVPTKLDWDNLRSMIQEEVSNFATCGGSATALTLTLSPAPTALVDGAIYKFKSTVSNTTSNPTLNVNGLGAKTIQNFNGQGLFKDEIAVGAYYIVQYNATGNSFVILSQNYSVTDFFNNIFDFASSSFSAGTYTLTFERSVVGTPLDILGGAVVRFVADADNTGATDIDDGLVTANLLKRGGAELVAGDIKSGDMVEICRLSAAGNWMLMSSGKGVNITGQTAVTAASGDEILIADVDDSNNPKKATANSIANTATGLTLGMGEVWVSSSAATAISTISRWYKAAGTTTLRMSHNFDANGASNRLRWIAGEDGHLHAGATCSFTTASSNQEIGAALAKQLDLATDPITTVGAGLSTIDINWPGHEAELTDIVDISGITGPIDGITAAQINTQHTITSLPDANTIRVTVASDTATAGSVSGGGSSGSGALVLISSETAIKNGTGADITSTAVHGMVHVGNNDSIELWVKNDTSGSNITLNHMNVFAVGVRI